MAESGGKDSHELATGRDSQWAVFTHLDDTYVGTTRDEVSDEKYFKLVQEVSELAARVGEYREKGPVEFGALVERSLSTFRQLPVLDSTAADASAKGEDKFSELSAQRLSLTHRLEAAAASLPPLLTELKDCTNRLDSWEKATHQEPGWVLGLP